MAWLLKSEYEWVIHSLSEKLDLAKHKHFLHFSLDVTKALQSDSSFLHYLDYGKKYLADAVKSTVVNICQLRTSKLYSAICACCVDDVNLAHVMSLLRAEEMLEGLVTDLPVSMNAAILIAMIGEMRAVEEDLRSNLTNSHFKEYRLKSAKFLKGVLKDLISLIIESGRDRATYVKEAIVSPPITPPRPTRGFKRSDLEEAKKLEEDIYGYSKKLIKDIAGDSYSDKYLQSIYSLYQRGDPNLERLLQAGSLASIWLRLHNLHHSNSPGGVQLIRWSIIRQIPRLNRMRQLIFTRLIQALCMPAWTPSHNVAVAPEITHKENQRLVKLVCESFLQSGVRLWCYEHDEQKSNILKSAALPNTLARAVVSVLCIKVDRGFVELNITDEMPDMESLSQMFAEWMPHGKMYEKLNICDMNLYRKVPEIYDDGYGSSTVMSSKLLGSRFHGAVPDFGISGEMRFFTNPLVTALIDHQKFSDTVDDFLQAKPQNQDFDEEYGLGIV